jgi:hypothetical protein
MLYTHNERLWWLTSTQQNSYPNKNTQGSHNQQTEQNQKQPRATHITRNNKRKEKSHYTEQQSPKLVQPVQLKMAS